MPDAEDLAARQSWGDDEFDVNSTETIVGECDRCGETKPTQKIIDPFVAEGISDADPECEWWCYPCLSRRCGDV